MPNSLFSTICWIFTQHVVFTLSSEKEINICWMLTNISLKSEGYTLKSWDIR